MTILWASVMRAEHLFVMNFFKNTQLMVQYTNTKEEARLLEKKALKEICINEFKDRYYNVKFF